MPNNREYIKSSTNSKARADGLLLMVSFIDLTKFVVLCYPMLGP
jgi:hypothetical protein